MTDQEIENTFDSILNELSQIIIPDSSYDDKQVSTTENHPVPLETEKAHG